MDPNKRVLIASEEQPKARVVECLGHFRQAGCVSMSAARSTLSRVVSCLSQILEVLACKAAHATIEYLAETCNAAAKSPCVVITSAYAFVQV